jgi:hypothetical protein
MTLRRAHAGLVLLTAATALVLPACGPRRPKDVNAIVPQISVNRPKVPLKSAIEVTYTWVCEPTMKKVADDYRAFVHFVDKDGVLLFTDDHLPSPAVSTWEPGKTYSYTRTIFIPNYSYVGNVEVRMGLDPIAGGRKPRLALKADDAGLREYRVLKLEFLPEPQNIYLVEKEGWHDPESNRDNPGLERAWTKKEAVLSFKNPKKDVIFYLEADTNYKAFKEPPALTISVNGTTGLILPIADSEIFLKRVRFKAADLGAGEWVDLRLTMSEAFNPKALKFNEDARDLGIMVYHRCVVEAQEAGPLAADAVVDAAPLPASVVAALKASMEAVKKPAADKGATKPAKKAAAAAKAHKATSTKK